MTPERILEAIEDARQAIEKYVPGLEPRCADLAFKGDVELDVSLAHALWMLPEMKEFVLKGRIDKAFRWLGFLQGILWVTGVMSIDDSRRANMPKDWMVR